MTLRTASRLAILSLLLFGCSGPSSAAPDVTRKPIKRMNVLFIGNSLTYANDLPLMVQALSRSAGQEMHVEQVTYGGYNFEDQWNQGTALAALSRARWDFVVMQQGPSSLVENREDMRKWTKQFAPKVREAGAQIALYMVWPELERISYFDAVRESYSLAASDVRGMFIPAGEAWRAAWRRDPKAPLYSSDDFHPSTAGTYTAALSIYGMVSKKSPVGLPARLELSNGTKVDLPQALATVLQEGAEEANRTYGRQR